MLLFVGDFTDYDFCDKKLPFDSVLISTFSVPYRCIISTLSISQFNYSIAGFRAFISSVC